MEKWRVHSGQGTRGSVSPDFLQVHGDEMILKGPGTWRGEFGGTSQEGRLAARVRAGLPGSER
jgi:hypothetical protein